MLNEPSSLAPRRARPRWQVLAVAAAAAAALHGWLLAPGLEPGAQPDASRTAALQVREVPAPVVAVPADSVPAEAKRPSKGAAPVKAKRIETPPRPVDVAIEAQSVESSGVDVDASLIRQVASPSATESATASSTAPAAASAATQAELVPVYRTVLPPAFRVRYELNRGFFSGTGELSWKPSADHYEARLEGSLAGMNLLTQVSSGVLDAHGLAPIRYTDARSRRATAAANFQRDKGKITYSGPQVEFPLVPGAQDRVSWMVQIGAILNAQPQLAAPEGKIVLFVSGAAGDADVWVFRYVGTENLRTDAGPWRTVKFTREPRKAYDRSVEVWLAPARHHLPVRARFTANAGGDAFELLLRDIQSP